MEDIYDSSLVDPYNSTPALMDTFPHLSSPDHYEDAKNIMQTYVVPIIILTGFFGNTICVIVFLASPLKRISTSAYLAALAISDTGFLVCLGIGWLESLGIRFFHKAGICQITVYASFVFSFTSIWFVNAFTLELYIAVFHPRKSPKWCTPANARRIVGLLSVVGGLIYIYAFWIAKLVPIGRPGYEVCLIVPEDEQTAMIFSVADTVLTLLVPFTMIMFMITRLLIHISRFYKTELKHSTSNSEANDSSEHQQATTNNNQTVRQANEAHAALSRMLVVTVVVFLVLNVPSHAIKVQFLFRSLLSRVEFSETEGFIQVIFQILYYANFSVNFLLYSACGRSFRSAMMRITLNVRFAFCRKMIDLKKGIDINGKKDSNDIPPAERNQPHSHLVDIHLNEIRFSQLPSIESQFVYKSPPCLLAMESEQLLDAKSINNN